MSLNISRAELRIGQPKMNGVKSISLRVLCLTQSASSAISRLTHANPLAVRVGKLLRICAIEKTLMKSDQAAA